MMMASHQSATVLSLIIKQVDREKHRRIGECKKSRKRIMMVILVMMA